MPFPPWQVQEKRDFTKGTEENFSGIHSQRIYLRYTQVTGKKKKALFKLLLNALEIVFPQ